MGQHILFAIVFAVIVGGRCWGEPPPDTRSAEDALPAEQGREGKVEAAPGGGDMIILGPESRYVTHGSLDRQGRLKVGCGHDGDTGGAPVEAK